MDRSGAPVNVILLSVDCLRYDTLGYEPDKSHLIRGGKDFSSLVKTPHLDAVARGGWVFHQCLSSAPYTTNAHATLLTGLWPMRHGLRSFYSETIRPEAKLLTEILKERGYSTLYSTSFPPIFHASSLGFSRGVDEFLNFEWFSPSILERSLEKTVSWAKSQKKSGRPFFIFCHTNVVHDYLNEETPVSGGEEGCLVRFGLVHRGDAIHQMEAYIASVNYLDRMFGAWVDRLRAETVLEDTLLIVTGDHGEAMRSDVRSHGAGLWPHLHDENLRVPLFFYCPSKIRPSRFERQVRHVDVVPTVLGCLRETAAGQFDGRDLGVWMRQHPHQGLEAYAEVWAPTRLVFRGYESSGQEGLSEFRGVLGSDGVRPDQGEIYRLSGRCVRWGRFKLVRNCVATMEKNRDWFFDVVLDPFEETYLDPRHGLHWDVFKALSVRMKSYELGDSLPDARVVDWAGQLVGISADPKEGASDEGTKPDPELLRQLRALGYI